MAVYYTIWLSNMDKGECLLPKTKIFLSSASQASYAALRNTSFDRINSLGHDALMYERNFGAWHNHEDSIAKCLKMVSECDIFILFVGHSAGSVTKHGRSVTHLEFEQALEDGKSILVFVEPDIKNEYLETVKNIISECLQDCRDRGVGRPLSQDIVKYIAKNKGRIGQHLQHVDDYVWYFLFEIMSEKKIFVQDLVQGVSIEWEVLFSDMFRDGVEMLRNKKDIMKNLSQIKELQYYKRFTSSIIPYLKLGMRDDLGNLIQVFKKSALGDNIIQDFGYLQRKIGEFYNCSAVTIYKKVEDNMVLVESVGNATSRDFDMDDDSSYVVLTQKHNCDNIFFRETNNCLYVCLKGADFVLTFRFPCGEGWSAQFYLDYRSNVENGIMNKNSELFELAISILEGVI